MLIKRRLVYFLWISSDKIPDKLRISGNRKLLKLFCYEKSTTNKKHVTGETGPEAETLHAFERPGAETRVLT